MSLPRGEPHAPAESAVARFDARVDSAVLRLPRSWRPAMWVATAIGYPVLEAVPLVVLAALSDGALRAASAALAVSLLLPRVLKHAVGRRRPESDYVAAMRMAGPSFPSGHAFSAVVAGGFYAYLAVTRAAEPWPVVVCAAAVAWVLWVSVSRLFFRAHFASDVVGGWLIAVVVLVAVLLVTTP